MIHYNINGITSYAPLPLHVSMYAGVIKMEPLHTLGTCILRSYPSVRSYILRRGNTEYRLDSADNYCYNVCMYYVDRCIHTMGAISWLPSRDSFTGDFPQGGVGLSSFAHPPPRSKVDAGPRELELQPSNAPISSSGH